MLDVCETQDVEFQRVEFIGFLEDSMVIILRTEILPNRCIYFFICIKVKVPLYDWAAIKSIDSSHLHQLVQPYQSLPMQDFWLSLEGLSLIQHFLDFISRSNTLNQFMRLILPKVDFGSVQWLQKEVVSLPKWSHTDLVPSELEFGASVQLPGEKVSTHFQSNFQQLCVLIW